MSDDANDPALDNFIVRFVDAQKRPVHIEEIIAATKWRDDIIIDRTLLSMVESGELIMVIPDSGVGDDGYLFMKPAPSGAGSL